MSAFPVVIIGAGPVGLAAAAHLLNRGLEPLVLEASDDVAAHIRDWGHVRVFSPWQYNIDKAARALLEPSGWIAPAPEGLPTGAELVELYLRPLSRLPSIAARLRLSHRVTAISRVGFDKVKSADRASAPFVLRVSTPTGEADILASAVLDASGTWSQPNPAGADGLPAIGEVAAADRIAYRIPDLLGRDRMRYAGQHVLVIGAGHSAANALLDLAQLAEQSPGTRISWAVRSTDLRRTFGGGDADALAARGALGSALRRLADSGHMELYAGFKTVAFQQATDSLTVTARDGRVITDVEQVIVATGQRPDLTMLRELRLGLDPWLESTAALGPLIDPNLHSCGTVRPHGAKELSHPEPGFFTVGIKSYGRAPTFLMATGYEQVRSVVAFLAGDLAAAAEVQLELPETGVCSVSLAGSPVNADCCGGLAPAGADACCEQDATAKAAGEAGCGCPPPTGTKTGCAA
ncbi:FAD-dependent oxidoreductase [Niveispirillum cyanobacteriorum]|nr:FAD-dependent oxidoreductase [Niveispirillum cyanobacteriorum]GGE83587.1 flavoprotein [Niveispirillum cyanobacteriorum]